MPSDTKWIFVSGGVLSGLGKGIVSASISKLLQLRNVEVAPIKCDGYLNVDPGTMNPHEHGEVFVLEDGTEVDMDFGHYERFLDIETSGKQNLTSGKIFKEVIDKERRGDFLGKTVQMVPHVTDHIKQSLKNAADGEEVIAVEIGGTVGDMENRLYLETARQILSEENGILVHTTLVPYLETTGEQKTKPTQHSVKELREMGLEPDIIVTRTEEELAEDAREKISLFCDVEEREVISDPNLETIYDLPLIFDEQNVDGLVAEKLGLPERQHNLDDWKKKVEAVKSGSVADIAICGKYTEMDDSYASVEEALKHAAAEEGGSVNIEYVDTEDFEPKTLEGFDGVIIPGGFGSRGVEGKIKTAQYCRENDVPLLGLCYGLQLMVVEYARNVLGLDAASQEFADGEDHEVVAELPDQKNIEEKGGTMRLGNYTAQLEGQVKKIYGSNESDERHRHRYELNPEYHEQLESNGLRISGKSHNGRLAEYIELPENNFYIGTQAHPEFNSTLENPNPLYLAFIQNCI
ncbi:MAG: CTP synthase [Candidatus Nanohaloarchaea archaeon]|jgi:CTP synthase